MDTRLDTTVLVLLATGDASGDRNAAVLTTARGLGTVHAVSLTGDSLTGDSLTGDGDLTGEGEAGLGRYGAAVVHRAELDSAAPAAVVAHALAGLAREIDAAAVLVPSEPAAAEVAALTAHALDAGLVLDVLDLEVGAQGRLATRRRAFGGTWDVQVEVTRPRAVVTVARAAGPAVPLPDHGAAEVRPYVVGPGPELHGRRVVQRTEAPAPGRPRLADADVVVVGGRGTEGAFEPLRELAAQLGGVIGSTGVAVVEGWADAETLVGQTGTTIAPRLYIGAGVSGAEHHRAGMSAAGTVVAVNSDPDAPIFELARFGVVGDLFAVLPQLTAELRRARS